MTQVATSITTTVHVSPQPYQHWPYVAEYSHTSVVSHVRPALLRSQGELADRVEFNQTAVLRRLRVSELDGRFVASCKELLVRECAHSVWMLKMLVAATCAVTLKDLENENVLKADSIWCEGTPRRERCAQGCW